MVLPNSRFIKNLLITLIFLLGMCEGTSHARNVAAFPFPSGAAVAAQHYGPTGSGWSTKSTCVLTGPIIVWDQFSYQANYSCDVYSLADDRYIGKGLASDNAVCPNGYFTDPSLKDELLCTDRQPDPNCVNGVSNGYCIGDSPKTAGCPQCAAGNPIGIGNGNKFQAETDIPPSKSSGMEFSRYYNSKFYVAQEALGGNWRHTYSRSISSLANSNIAKVYRPDGKRIDFVNVGGVWKTDGDIIDSLIELKDGGGNRTGWRYVNGADDTELYNSAGNILSITTRSGLIQTFTYSDGSTSGNQGAVFVDANGDSVSPNIVLPAGILIKVTDNWGKSLVLAYDQQYRLVKLTDPSSQNYLYRYDQSGNLASVSYPDNKQRIYQYNEAAYTGGQNLPNALTGIVDENGSRFATWRYDGDFATSSEHANGLEKYSLNFVSRFSRSIVTDPIGTQRTYDFQTILSIPKNIGSSQPSGVGSSAATSTITYDANGNVSSRTDFNGNKTCYAYDLSRNLETARVEGLPGTMDCAAALSGSLAAPARKISTAWHPTYRLPVLIAEPKRLTQFDYDPSGNLLTRTVKATSDLTGAQGASAAVVGAPRIWRYTYNGVGQVLTATGPRTDVADTTTYVYDQATGNLLTATNAAGHVATFSNYDANGRVGQIVDANGLTTVLAYTPRGWLDTKTVTGNGVSELTKYEYDGVGQLKKVTLPDSSFVSYTYDDAHRLTDIVDSAGNSIHYVLDAMGNRTNEQVKDPQGNLSRQVTRIYDALNRLQTVTGASQ